MQIEKDEEYIKAVTSLGGVVEQLIKANNAINIYEEYFPDAPPAPGSDAPGVTNEGLARMRRARYNTTSVLSTFFPIFLRGACVAACCRARCLLMEVVFITRDCGYKFLFV